MEKKRLATNGRNFTKWDLNLTILLKAAQKTYVLDAPLGAPPADEAPDEDKNVFLTR